MLEQQKFNKYFFSSLLLHTIILLVLIVNLELSSRMPVVRNSDQPEVIDAMIMEEPPEQTSHIIQRPPAPVKPIFPPEPKPPAKPEVKSEPDPVKPLVIPDEKLKKLREAMLQKQLLDELKNQAEIKKKLKQKNIQAALEKEMKEMKAQALQQQMLQEQKRLANIQTQQMRGVVDKYKALILQTISQHWLIPANVNKKLTAHLLIRVAPGEMVLDVQLIKSSGDDALDRSARAAVFKASPLPVPRDAEAFESFRQFVLKVKPENVLTTS